MPRPSPLTDPNERASRIRFFIPGGHSPIITDQEIYFGDSCELLGITAIAARDGEVGPKPGQASIEGGISFATRQVRRCSVSISPCASFSSRAFSNARTWSSVRIKPSGR